MGERAGQSGIIGNRHHYSALRDLGDPPASGFQGDHLHYGHLVGSPVELELATSDLRVYGSMSRTLPVSVGRHPYSSSSRAIAILLSTGSRPHCHGS